MVKGKSRKLKRELYNDDKPLLFSMFIGFVSVPIIFIFVEEPTLAFVYSVLSFCVLSFLTKLTLIVFEDDLPNCLKSYVNYNSRKRL